MVISFINNKGGVGKTTSTVNVGKALVLKGYKVLVVDADAQGNSSKMCGFQREGTESLYELMSGKCNVSDCIYTRDDESSVDYIPSSRELSRCEMELVSMTGREYILKNRIAPVTGMYDYILIDCPPSNGLITINAMCCSDMVIVPINCEVFAIDGMGVITSKINEIKTLVNPNLDVLGYLLTRYDKRLSLHKEVEKSMREMFDSKVFETKIRTNIPLAESPSVYQDIFDYNPDSPGAKDYMDLADEILKRLEKK